MITAPHERSLKRLLKSLYLHRGRVRPISLPVHNFFRESFEALNLSSSITSARSDAPAKPPGFGTPLLPSWCMEKKDFTKRYARRTRSTPAEAADQIDGVVNDLLRRLRAGQPEIGRAH